MISDVEDSMRFSLLSLFTVVALMLVGSSCGDVQSSGLPPTTDTSPPTTIVDRVIGDPDQVAFRYVASGGIAGITAFDVVVYGDGSGTVTTFEEEGRQITITPDELNRLLVDLETAGVHRIDPADHPNVPVADGFGVGITVHTTNGSSEIGIYGLGEAPELFDEDWRSLAEAAAKAANSIG